MSVNRILCTEESLLITLNKILTGRECISLPVFYLIFSPDLGYNDSNRAYQMESNGNVVDYDWGIGNSYGMIYTINKKFKFRSLAPDYGSYDFSTYCVNSSVTATAIGISTFPTGISTSRKNPFFALRTSVSAAVRVKWGRMVMSTTVAVGLSRVPTGIMHLRSLKSPSVYGV